MLEVDEVVEFVAYNIPHTRDGRDSLAAAGTRAQQNGFSYSFEPAGNNKWRLRPHFSVPAPSRLHSDRPSWCDERLVVALNDHDCTIVSVCVNGSVISGVAHMAHALSQERASVIRVEYMSSVVDGYLTRSASNAPPRKFILNLYSSVGGDTALITAPELVPSADGETLVALVPPVEQPVAPYWDEDPVADPAMVPHIPNLPHPVRDNAASIAALQEYSLVDMTTEELLLCLPTLTPSAPDIARGTESRLFNLYAHLWAHIEGEADAGIRDGLFIRFMIADFVLFAPSRDTQNTITRMEVTQRFNRLMADDWAWAVPSYFKPVKARKNKEGAREWNRGLMALYEKGELSRISARVFKLGLGGAAHGLPTAAQLESITRSFPAKRLNVPLDVSPIILDDEVDAGEGMDNNVNLGDGTLSKEDLKQQIKNARRMLAPGPDGSRVDHLKVLGLHVKHLGRDQKVLVDKALTAITGVLNLLHSNAFGSDVIRFFASARLYLVPKNNAPRLSDGSVAVRPAQSGGHLRKLAAKQFKVVNRGAVEKFMGDTQVGETRDGLTKLVQMAIHALDTQLGDEDLCLIDNHNAFNEISRELGVHETRRRFPSLAPHLQLMYDSDTDAVFYGLRQGTQLLPQQEGSQQGCVLGGFMFNVASLQLINKLDALLKDKEASNNVRAFARAYFDDASLFARPDRMREALLLLGIEGKRIGCLLNLPKTVIIMGPRGSYDKALADVEAYAQLGLPYVNIRMSPRDVPDNWVYIKKLTDVRHGARLLGGAIGSHAFKAAFYRDLVKSLETEASRLADVQDTTLRLDLFIKCFSRKIDFLFRAFPSCPALTQCRKAFDLLSRDLFSSSVLQIGPDNLHNRAWKQVQFPVDMGGLGARNSPVVRAAAFIVGTLASKEYVDRAFPGHMESLANADSAYADALLAEGETPDELPSLIRSFAVAIQQFNKVVGFDALTSKGLVMRNDLGRASQDTAKEVEKMHEWLGANLSQRILTEKAYKALIFKFLDTNKDTYDIQAWHGKLNSFMANRWLSGRPLSLEGSSFKLSSEEARVELLFWLSIPFHGIIGGNNRPREGVLYDRGALCDCNKPPDERKVGPFGHHFLSCGKGSSGSYMHSAVQKLLDSCRRQAGIRGGMEMKVDNARGERDGDVGFLDDIFPEGSNANGFDKCVVDIIITDVQSAKLAVGANGTVNGSSTMPTATYSRAHPFIAGKIAHKSKCSAATIDRCNSNGFEFRCFAIESTGYCSKDVEAILAHLSKIAASKLVEDTQFEEGEAKRILSKWRFQFSVALRKSHARAILDRIRALKINPVYVTQSRQCLFKSARTVNTWNFV